MKRTGLIMGLIGGMMSGCVFAQSPVSDAKMNAFVGKLMSQMTLEEKIGQLNLLSVGFDVTGPELSKDVEPKIRQPEHTGCPAFAGHDAGRLRRLRELPIEGEALNTDEKRT